MKEENVIHELHGQALANTTVESQPIDLMTTELRTNLPNPWKTRATINPV
jgi:hypothetical protein